MSLTETGGTPTAPESVLVRIQKLLNLAAKNTSAEEAASAAAKAQELLEQWNLNVSTVENAASADGRREDAKVTGGFYKWQRWLWCSVAELHFCLYWTQEYWDKNQRTHEKCWDGSSKKGAYRKRHRLVGRVVNVKATEHLAKYLENAIEELVKARTQGARSQAFSNWASSYRLGAATKLVERLEDRRRQRVDAAARAAREAAERAGTSTSTALTLADVEEREQAANQDFLYGEGWTAKRAAARAARAEADRLAAEEYTRWAASNPEEAAAKEAERREAYEKTMKQRRRSYGRVERDNTDYSAYYAGSDAAKNISLDPQVDTARPAGLLR
jgi:hypothetical protein